MYLNTLSRTAIAAAVLLGSALHANAAVNNLGNVSAGAPTSFNSASTSAGPFSDIFSFNVSSPSVIGFNVINFPVAGLFNTVITSASLFSNTDGLLFNSDDQSVGFGSIQNNSSSFVSSALSAGSYYLNVTGIANGPQGGLYNGAISVAAVPEPETYAMLLAGLGVMGFIARRRNKSV